MVLFVLSQDVLQAVTPFLQGWLNGGYFGPESSLASIESVELKLPGFESFPQPGHRCNTFEPWFLFAFPWNPFDFKGVKDDTETWAPIFDSPRHFSLCRITSPFTCYLLRGWLQGLEGVYLWVLHSTQVWNVEVTTIYSLKWACLQK